MNRTNTGVYHVASINTSYNTTTEKVDDSTDDKYDHVGAMHFVVATVLVYSILGVFCVLLSRIKRTRGKSHEHHVHDENIARYLKQEKSLKSDAMKMKLLYECELVAKKVKSIEERQKLKELENGFSSDYFPESTADDRNKKRMRKKKRTIRNALGLMGASLFFLEPDSNASIESIESGSRLHIPDDSGINVSDGQTRKMDSEKDTAHDTDPFLHNTCDSESDDYLKHLVSGTQFSIPNSRI